MKARPGSAINAYLSLLAHFPSMPKKKKSDDTGALLTEGEKLICTGKFKEAVDTLGKAINALEAKDGNGAPLAKAYRRRAYGLTRLSRYKEAVEDNMKALRISMTIGDKALEADTLRGLGAVHWQMGDPRMAQEFHDKALAMARELKDKDLEGQVLIEQANIMNSGGKNEDAINLYRRAINKLGGTENWNELARAYNNMGNAFHNLDRINEAAKCLQKAIVFAEMSGNRNTAGWARLNLGECYLVTENYELAKTFLDQAVAQFKATGDIMGLTATWTNIGELYCKEGKFPLSLQAFDEAEANAKKGGIERLRALVLFHRAETYERMEDYVAALKAFEDARPLLKDVGQDSEVSDSEIAIERLKKLMGKA